MPAGRATKINTENRQIHTDPALRMATKEQKKPICQKLLEWSILEGYTAYITLPTVGNALNHWIHLQH
uniref:Uncharacterized protein n=1 Tax=Rhizophora mucronata TaxID=61149 RepID=A0A2P2K7S8_RHIMU